MAIAGSSSPGMINISSSVSAASASTICTGAAGIEIVSSCVAYPTREALMLWLPSLRTIENEPLASLIVPYFPPSTEIVVHGKGSPDASTTDPAKGA